MGPGSVAEIPDTIGVVSGANLQEVLQSALENLPVDGADMGRNVVDLLLKQLKNQDASTNALVNALNSIKDTGGNIGANINVELVGNLQNIDEYIAELSNLKDGLGTVGNLLNALALWEINYQFYQFEQVMHTYTPEEQINIVSDMIEEAVLVFNPIGFIPGVDEGIKDWVPTEEWLTQFAGWLRNQDSFVHFAHKLQDTPASEWRSLFNRNRPAISIEDRLNR